MKSARIIILLIIALQLPNFLYAEITVAAVFGDHMVLQREMPISIWGKAEPGAEIKISLAQNSVDTVCSDNGKWQVNMPSMEAGGPYDLIIKSGNDNISFSDIYIGDVWLCSGQSNMDMTVATEDQYWCGVENQQQEVANANYPLIRVFDVEFNTSDYPLDTLSGKWEICSPETVGHFSAAAYFMARDLQEHLNIPIGLITSAYGASTAETWTSRESLVNNTQLRFLIDNYAAKKEEYDSDFARQEKYKQDLKKYKIAYAKAKAQGTKLPRGVRTQDPRNDQHSPYTCYNAMIAPLIPYGIKGAIWYQGESNGATSKLYDIIMETLVNNWRDSWGQGPFPFIYVQLANYGKPSDNPNKPSQMAEVRFAQLNNLSITNSAMASAIDIGDEKNIHPKNKQDVGKRLALCARAIAYGEDIVYMGPIYREMTVEGNKAIISFDHIGSGLAAKDGKLTGFAIGGHNNKYHWAEAEIVDNTVVVYSDKVDRPISVRYAYGDNPKCSLFNNEGLPASPFVAY